MGIFVNAASEIYCQAFLQVNSHTPLYQPIKSIGNVPGKARTKPATPERIFFRYALLHCRQRS